MAVAALPGLSTGQAVPRDAAVPRPGTAVPRPASAHGAAGQEGRRCSWSALGPAKAATPAPGTRPLRRKQVKPDAHQAEDTPPCSRRAGARRASHALRRESPGKAPAADTTALWEQSGLRVSHSSFQTPKTLPLPSPQASLHADKSRSKKGKELPAPRPGHAVRKRRDPPQGCPPAPGHAQSTLKHPLSSGDRHREARLWLLALLTPHHRAHSRRAGAAAAIRPTVTMAS